MKLGGVKNDRDAAERSGDPEALTEFEREELCRRRKQTRGVPVRVLCLAVQGPAVPPVRRCGAPGRDPRDQSASPLHLWSAQGVGSAPLSWPSGGTHRVARLMAAHGLVGADSRRRWRRGTHPKMMPAPDLLEGDFDDRTPAETYAAARAA